MTFLRGVAREILGMFVDDGSLALGVIIWIAAVAVIFGLGLIGQGIAGPALFIGVLVILIENVFRRARRR